MDPTSLREIAGAVRGRWIPCSAASFPGKTGPAGSGEAAPPPDIFARRVATDSRALEPGDLFVALPGERFDGHDFAAAAAATAAACVVAEARAAEIASRIRAAAAPAARGFGLIAVDQPLAALERLAAWHRRRLAARVLAVTGSVGKTTVKEFLGQLLARSFETVRAPKSFNNRLGVALTLLEAGRSTRFVVAELGTSAPGEIAGLAAAASPDAALVTAIGPAHLEQLGDLEGVARAKAEIFTGLRSGGPAFIARPIAFEEHLLGEAAANAGLVFRFGWALGGAVEEGYWITRLEPLDTATHPSQPPLRGGVAAALPDGAGESGHPANGRARRAGFRFEVNGGRLFELLHPGRHNVFNALAAVAMAREFGLDWEALQQGVRDLRLPPLRLAVAEAGGVTVVDDTYNANPLSVRAALEAVDGIPLEPGGRWHLVLGDLRELGAGSREMHRELGEELARSGTIARLWTVGEEARESAAAATALGLAAEARGAGDEEALAEDLGAALRPGDGVLLKGSRAVALERLAARLRDLLAEPAIGRGEGRERENRAPLPA